MDKEQPRFFILVGDQESWEISIKKKIWGFGERTKGLWNTSQPNDLLAFYVTRPIGKVIGFGKITGKNVDDSLLWPDEFRFKRSMWKYKIQIKILYSVKDWNKGVSVPTGLMLNTGRKLVTKEIFASLIKNADSKWGTDLHQQIPYI